MVDIASKSRLGTDLARPGTGGAAPGAAATSVEAPAVLAFARDPFRVLLVALTIINVSRFHHQYGVLVALRPALVLVLAAAAYAYLYPKVLSRVNVFRFWPMRRVALLGVLACFSVGFGIALGRSALFILDNYSKVLLYCFLLAIAIRGVRDLYTFIWAYVVSCGILSFYSLFVFKLTRVAPGAIARLSNLYTYDANDVCVVLLIGLAFVLLLLQVERGVKRLVLFAILIGIGGSIARSGSRGGFIGLVVFGAAALLMINTVSLARKVISLGAVILALVAFAPPGYWDQMQTITSLEEDYNFTSPDGRKALAKRGVRYMLTYPVFGVGINNFGRAECTISGEKVGGGGVRCGAPHNSYVQAGAELGIPGLLVWSSLIFGGIWALLGLRRRLPQGWRRGNSVERFLYNATHYIALGLAGFAASAFFVSFAWLDIIYIMMALITGLYVSIHVYRTQSAVTGSGVPAAAQRQRRAGWRVTESAERARAWRRLSGSARPA